MIDMSPFPAKLTARQQQILDLIQSAIARTGAPPTRAEIATELGFKSANAAEEHLQALARKGVIELVSGTSRGIRLKSDALRSINESRMKQFSLPLPSLAQLALPLIGRVAAGSPILAQEHVDQTYYVESSLFQRQPDYLLKVRGMSMRDAGIMDGDLLAVQNQGSQERPDRRRPPGRRGHRQALPPQQAPDRAACREPRFPDHRGGAWRAFRDRGPRRRADPQHHVDVGPGHRTLQPTRRGRWRAFGTPCGAITLQRRVLCKSCLCSTSNP
jgi:repressor LexA